MYSKFIAAMLQDGSSIAERPNMTNPRKCFVSMKATAEARVKILGRAAHSTL